MSLEVADANGPFGQFASNNGFAELVSAANSDAVLRLFFTHGATEDTKAAAAHLRALKGKDDVEETAKGLAQLIDGKDFVLITRGESDGDEEDGDVDKGSPDQERDDHGRWTSTGFKGDFKGNDAKTIQSLLSKLDPLCRTNQGRPAGNAAIEKGLALTQIKQDPDLARIVSEGKAYQSETYNARTGTISEKFVPMEDGKCHWNVSELFQKGKIDAIVIGYSAPTPLIPGEGKVYWHQHTWGLKGRQVVETCLSNKGNLYFGLALSKAESQAFAKWAEKNPSGGGKVRRLV